MRKLILFLLFLFVCTNVYARGFLSAGSGGVVPEKLTFKNGEDLQSLREQGIELLKLFHGKRMRNPSFQWWTSKISYAEVGEGFDCCSLT